MWHERLSIGSRFFCANKGTRSVGGGVAELSALVECAELLCNLGISFEKYLLKRVWHLFSTNLPNLRFFCTFSQLAMLSASAAVQVPVMNSSIVWHDIAQATVIWQSLFASKGTRSAHLVARKSKEKC